jgi:hypothetical protein
MDCAPGLTERNVAQDAREASQPVGSVGEQHIAEAQLERIAGLRIRQLKGLVPEQRLESKDWATRDRRKDRQ